MRAHGRASRMVAALAICFLVAGCASSATSTPSVSSEAIGRRGDARRAATPAPVTPAPVTPAPATPAPSVDPNAFSVRTFYTTYVPDALFAVDADGNAYLPGGTEGAALVKVGPDGAPIARWAGKDTVPGQPDTVGGVVVDPKTGDVWLTDMTADKVVRLSSDLVEKDRWGTTGREPGDAHAARGDRPRRQGQRRRGGHGQQPDRDLQAGRHLHPHDRDAAGGQQPDRCRGRQGRHAPGLGLRRELQRRSSAADEGRRVRGPVVSAGRRSMAVS